jgi:hypothetical protein
MKLNHYTKIYYNTDSSTCVCLLYALLYLIIYDTSAKKSLNIPEGSITYCSTVCVLGLLGDDTLVDEINVAPVLALSTLSVDKIS